MSRLTLLLIVLPACGGNAFEALGGGPDTGLPDDAQTSAEAADTSLGGDDATGLDEGTAESSTGHEGGAGHDAGITDATAPVDAHDSGLPPVDAAPDVVICTPFPANAQWHCDGQNIYEPSNFCENFGTGPFDQSTPSACQCVETYNCACIEANIGNMGCPGLTFHSCVEYDGGFELSCGQ